MDNQPLPCPMCGKHALQMITGDVVCQSGNCGLRLNNLEGEAYATTVERWNRHYCTRRASRSSVPPTPTKIPVIEPDGKVWLDDLTTKLIDLRDEATDAGRQCEHRSAPTEARQEVKSLLQRLSNWCDRVCDEAAFDGYASWRKADASASAPTEDSQLLDWLEAHWQEADEGHLLYAANIRDAIRDAIRSARAATEDTPNDSPPPTEALRKLADLALPSTGPAIP